MTTHFFTESGTQYEIAATPDDYIVRRSPEYRYADLNHLRGDGEWVSLLAMPSLKVGQPVVMQLQLPGVTSTTTRTTTPITRIWHDDKEAA